MNILEDQRTAFLTALGNTAANKALAHPRLMFNYLGSLGYTQPSLGERVQQWAVARNISQTLAYTRVGLTP